MDRQKAAKLANLIIECRPGWNARDITDILERMDGPLNKLAAHAIEVATDPSTRYPVRMRATWVNPTDKSGNRLPCEHCGRNEWACYRAQRNTRIDTHDYRAHEIGAGHAPRQIEETDLWQILKPLNPELPTDDQ